ncbi:MAG: hypothetical protein MET45_04295 [Nostoc sp. LLA-1]|nr:hypothetical protein [Cyanocohniella sp. LLY]
MTVKVYIWKGNLPKYTVYSELITGTTGHASLEIIDDSKQLENVYISHRLQIIHSDKKFTLWNKFKAFVLEPAKSKASFISYRDECIKRKSQPDVEIEIPGLNENNMRKLAVPYLNDEILLSKYHIHWNNCCKVVAYFIKKGLECSNGNYCSFCNPRMYLEKGRGLVSIILLFVGGIVVWIYRSLTYINKNIAPFLYIFVAICGSVYWRFSRYIIPTLAVFFDIEYTATMYALVDFWSPKTLEKFSYSVQKYLNNKKPNKPLCKQSKFGAFFFQLSKRNLNNYQNEALNTNKKNETFNAAK